MSAGSTLAPVESPTRRRIATVCAACQRLNGSVSWRRSARRSSFERSSTTFTGAEKPRKTDGTGRAATFVKVRLSAGLSSTKTPSGPTRSQRARARLRPAPRGRARPGSPSAPSSAARGVGGVSCAKSSR